MASYQYDLVVVGSGPAGQKAAICAAKLRKQVAVTDRRHMLGGIRIVDSDQALTSPQIPRELIVVGAGVIGLEYASMLTALNVKVTLIDQRPHPLEFVDAQILDTLYYHMRRNGAVFRFGEKVTKVEIDERDRVVAVLESGKRIHGEGLLYTVGRQANPDQMN